MRNTILAWYAFSESGAAGVAIAEDHAFEQADQPDAREVPESSADLDDAAEVAALFAEARRLDAEVDARGWQHLFGRFGLHGLIDLAKGRRAGWPAASSEETVADAIFSESLDAGYDPVSGLIGRYVKETKQFVPASWDERLAHDSAPGDEDEVEELSAALARR